jgi:surfactin synthase thioesterase subunit
MTNTVVTPAELRARADLVRDSNAAEVSAGDEAERLLRVVADEIERLQREKASVLEFLSAFIAGGVNQDFRPWARELYGKLHHNTVEPPANREFIVPPLPQDVVEKLNQTLLGDGVAYLQFTAGQPPLVLRQKEMQ